MLKTLLPRAAGGQSAHPSINVSTFCNPGLSRAWGPQPQPPGGPSPQKFIPQKCTWQSGEFPSLTHTRFEHEIYQMGKGELGGSKRLARGDGLWCNAWERGLGERGGWGAESLLCVTHSDKEPCGCVCVGGRRVKHTQAVNTYRQVTQEPLILSCSCE